ncbi:unnamed protein product [Lactuca saligna]|uniref:HAT C-terminal dimerisation domain-containing protein n=1 Tax=Lactuca saligna TaxID=75948 RepID=A0AA35VP23_LACSI|nr:unnamed protein product [Lactuca saligna]
MGEQMRKKFDKYYGDFGKTNEMVLVAVALDPSSSNTNDNDVQNFVGVVKNKQMRKISDEFYENDVEDATEKSELEEYLDAPPKKMNNETFEISKWWSDKCTTYKLLASMAKDILAIPVSTVASESTFSTSGRVVDDFWSNLLPKTVEALICTQDWLRASNVCVDLEQLLEDVEKYQEEISRNMEDLLRGNK